MPEATRCQGHQRDNREPIHQLLVDTAMFTDDEVTVALELIDCVLHEAEQKDYTMYTGVGEGDRVLSASRSDEARPG